MMIQRNLDNHMTPYDRALCNSEKEKLPGINRNKPQAQEGTAICQLGLCESGVL